MRLSNFMTRRKNIRKTVFAALGICMCVLASDPVDLAAAGETSGAADVIQTREFDSCIIKIVRAGRIKPVLFLSSFSLYYLVIFSDM